MELQNLLLVIVFLLALSAAGLTTVLFSRLRAEQARVASVESDLRALCNAAVAVGDRINQMERRLRQLSQKQEELGLQQTQSESDVRSFEQAAKLAKKGASIEEVVEICGLSRGEAELVAMMHRLERK